MTSAGMAAPMHAPSRRRSAWARASAVRPSRTRSPISCRSLFPQALVHAGDVARAEQVLEEALAARVVPEARAFNALLHHYAGAGSVAGAGPSVADAARLLGRMSVAGVVPTRHSFSAALRTCQHAGEAALAMEVYGVMRAQGHALDASGLFTLLRTCHNRLRGTPDPGSLHAPDGQAVVEALQGRQSPARPGPPTDRAARRFGVDAAAALSGAVSWADRALAIYRDASAHGLRADLRSLSMLLACLAVPREDADAAGQGLPAEGHYDPRIGQVVEEAIAAGTLPPFQLGPGATGNAEVDLRDLTPVAAQVYTLCYFQALRRTLRWEFGIKQICCCLRVTAKTRPMPPIASLPASPLTPPIASPLTSPAGLTSSARPVSSPWTWFCASPPSTPSPSTSPPARRPTTPPPRCPRASRRCPSGWPRSSRGR